MSYVPPHLRKAVQKKTTRTEFRQDFPQLAPPLETAPAISFSHIKDLVEPLPPKEAPGLPLGWVNLRNPDTYLCKRPTLDSLAQTTILRMIDRWMAWDREHDIFIKYECEDEFNDEDDEDESDTSSTTVEDAEYFSDE